MSKTKDTNKDTNNDIDNDKNKESSVTGSSYQDYKAEVGGCCGIDESVDLIV